MAFLLGSAVDKDLDDLFSSSKKDIPKANTPSESSKKSKKRKHHETKPIESQEHLPTTSAELSPGKKKKHRKDASKSEKDAEPSAKKSKSSKKKIDPSSPPKAPTDIVPPESPPVPVKSSDIPTPANLKQEEVPQHETLTSAPSKTQLKHPKKKAAYIPSDETSSQRDSRTLFIGNVELSVFKDQKERKALKEIKRLVQGCFAEVKQKLAVDSMRIRSVPFATQTKNKKEAWLKKDIHPQGKTCSVFVVLGFGDLLQGAKGEPRPHENFLNPYHSANIVASSLNGTMYMGRRLRVDVVGPPTDGPDSTSPFTPSRTLFLGSLDFVIDEEAVRKLFNKVATDVLAEEEGDSDSDNADDTTAKKVQSSPTSLPHVRNVHIIRDRETQVGTGIGYIELNTTHTLDVLLALYKATPGKFKVEGRKIRIERCKAQSKTKTKTLPSSSQSTSSRQLPPIPPSTKSKEQKAAELGRMPKAERKVVKKMDRERIDRRLRKKLGKKKASGDKKRGSVKKELFSGRRKGKK